MVCTQNHDQVGNRARGDRLSHLVGADAQLVAAALVLCSPGTPLVFMGEEWAASTPFPYFVDVPGDPGLADAVGRGRRRSSASSAGRPRTSPTPPPSTFESAVLNWDERDDARTVLDFYRRLLAPRRAPT